VANSRTRANRLRSPDRADSKVAAASRNLASRIKIGSGPQRSQFSLKPRSRRGFFLPHLS
jgi:hypothetical protein